MKKNPHASALGQKGGNARAAKMTKKQRSAAAKAAAAARWANHTYSDKVSAKSQRKRRSQ